MERDWATDWLMCGLIHGKGKAVFSSPEHPDSLWSPASPLLNGYWGIFPWQWQGFEWMQLYHCLHCILKDNFIFLCLVIQGVTSYSLISTMVERNIKDEDSHEINILAIISMVIWRELWANNSPGTFLKPTHTLIFHYKLMNTKSNISLSISIMAK